MIVRRYGKTMQSVSPNFDARAMNEVGFLRTDDFTMPAEEFETVFARGEEHLLTAESTGDVQGHVEEEVLQKLSGQLAALLLQVDDNSVLRIESEPGSDYPKTRSTQTSEVVGAENRLHFRYVIEPPLRCVLWHRKA
jgi:hypothetical protein